MNIKDMAGVLHRNGYNLAKNTNPKFLFYCKTENKDFSAIVLVDDIHFEPVNGPLIFQSIRESLEKTFYLRGYTSVNTLFIIATANPFSYKMLTDTDLTFWVADVNNDRIISYASDDSMYDTLRQALEKPSTTEPTHQFTRHKFFSTPFITILFAAINVCIFLYMDFFGDLGDILYMYAHGTSEWRSIIEGGEYYRLITSMFIHFDIGHLCNNMLSLVALGSQLEPAMGHTKFFITYMISGLAASCASVFYHYSYDANVISAGASGAVFGMFGAYAIYALFDMIRHRQVSFRKIAILSILMIYNGMASENVDNAAHLGGMIFGCIIAFICCICKKNKI